MVSGKIIFRIHSSTMLRFPRIQLMIIHTCNLSLWSPTQLRLNILYLSRRFESVYGETIGCRKSLLHKAALMWGPLTILKAAVIICNPFSSICLRVYLMYRTNLLTNCIFLDDLAFFKIFCRFHWIGNKSKWLKVLLHKIYKDFKLDISGWGGILIYQCSFSTDVWNWPNLFLYLLKLVLSDFLIRS